MEDTKNSERPNWKQWLPLYGIYQATHDELNGEPVIFDNGRREPPKFDKYHPHKLGTYHIAVGVGSLVGLATIVEKLF